MLSNSPGSTVSITRCSANACGRTSTVKSNVSGDGFSPGRPHINCRQIERPRADALFSKSQVPGRPQVPDWGPDPGTGSTSIVVLRICRRDAKRYLCCLLPSLGFYFHLCFLSASLKSRTGRRGRVAGGGETFVSVIIVAHTSNNKKYLSDTCPKSNERKQHGTNKKSREKKTATSVKINKKN